MQSLCALAELAFLQILQQAQKLAFELNSQGDIPLARMNTFMAP